MDSVERRPTSLRNSEGTLIWKLPKPQLHVRKHRFTFQRKKNPSFRGLLRVIFRLVPPFTTNTLSTHSPNTSCSWFASRVKMIDPKKIWLEKPNPMNKKTLPWATHPNFWLECLFLTMSPNLPTTPTHHQRCKFFQRNDGTCHSQDGRSPSVR